MRNLKRVLSLALATVMLLGMMVIGAGAADAKKVDIKASDLTDMDKVTNKAAVSLLVDLKVIEGKQDKTFAPAEIVDRASMTKMIYYIRMGSTDASAFVGVDSKLSDIKGNWAEGFINYCFSNGIVAGIGENKFDPSGKLTTVSAAKMLLVALGYDADAQGYQNDPQWSVNIIRDAQKNGLLEGVTEGANAQLSRDSAAKMIYNALFAKTVTNVYGRDLNGKKYVSSTTQNATTLGEETYKLAKVEGVVTGVSANGKAIIDGVVSDLPVSPDQIGAKVAYYRNSASGKLISTSLAVSKSVVLGTSTNGKLINKLNNAGLTTYVAAADTTVSYFKNGVVETVLTDDHGSEGVAGANSANNVPDAIDTLTAVKGAVVEFIDNNGNGKYDVVRVTTKTVDTITDGGVVITKATSSNLKDAIKINGIGVINGTIAAENVFGYADLVKDDVVLWYTIGNKYYIEKAATVSGNITGKKTTGYVMDGTSYPVSGLVTGAPATAVTDLLEANYNKDTTLYLDNNKSIVKAKLNEKAADAQYAVIRDLVFIPGTNAAGSAAKGRTDALLVYVDGTSEVKTISAIDGYTPTHVTTSDAGITGTTKIKDLSTGGFYLTGATAAIVETGDASAVAELTLNPGAYAITYNQAAASGRTTIGKYIGVSEKNAATALEGKFFTYTVNKDGTVALKTALGNDAVTVSAGYKTGTPTIGAENVKINNNTVFILTTQKNNKDVFTVYTGMSALPNLANATKGFAAYKNSTAVVASYVFLAGATDAATATNLAYFGTKDYSEFVPKNGDVAAHYVYNAVVKGELTTVKVDASTTITSAGIWTINLVDGVVTAGAGTAKLASTTTASNVVIPAAAGTVKAADGIIGFGQAAGAVSTATYYTYNDDTKVFFVAANGTITAGNLADIATDKDDTVVLTVVKGTGTGAEIAKATTLTAIYVQAVGTNAGGVAGGDDTVYTKSFTATMTPANGVAKVTVTPVLTNGANTAMDDLDGTITLKLMMLNPISGQPELQSTKTVVLTDGVQSAIDLAVTSTGYYKVEWTVTVPGMAPVSGTTSTVNVTALA